MSSVTNVKSKALSYKVYQDKTFFLFDELSTSNQRKNCIEQPLNFCVLLIITCLLLVVHLPYILLAFFDISTLQLSTFIYIHWFGALFLPMIHFK